MAGAGQAARRRGETATITPSRPTPAQRKAIWTPPRAIIAPAMNTNMLEHDADMVVGEVNVRFLGPARFDDEIAITPTVERLGNSSITTRFVARRPKDDALVLDVKTGSGACGSTSSRAESSAMAAPTRPIRASRLSWRVSLCGWRKAKAAIRPATSSALVAARGSLDRLAVRLPAWICAEIAAGGALRREAVGKQQGPQSGVAALSRCD